MVSVSFRTADKTFDKKEKKKTKKETETGRLGMVDYSWFSFTEISHGHFNSLVWPEDKVKWALKPKKKKLPRHRAW